APGGTGEWEWGLLWRGALCIMRGTTFLPTFAAWDLLGRLAWLPSGSAHFGPKKNGSARGKTLLLAPDPSRCDVAWHIVACVLPDYIPCPAQGEGGKREHPGWRADRQKIWYHWLSLSPLQLVEGKTLPPRS